LNTTDATTSRGDQLAALTYFYTFNVLLLAIVGHGYLANIPSGTSVIGWIVTVLAFVANFAMLALVPMLLSSVALIWRRQWITLLAAILFFGSLNVFIYVDLFIYQLWRFHFNSMVINLLTTAGAGDSVTAGTSTLVSASIVFAAIFAAEVGFAWIGLPRLKRFTWAGRLNCRKGFVLWLTAVASLILANMIAYDIGHLRDDEEILRLHTILPLYQSVTIKRFANRVLGMNISPTSGFRMHKVTGSLDYPKAPLRLSPGTPRPNIVIIALEGARYDMLAPDVMPALWQFGQTNLVFENHYSGGNCTRYGIFTMLYGIYGTYWQRALHEQHGPALVRLLKDNGYKFRILSCSDLNYPEFRSTAFIDIPDSIWDHPHCERVERDRLMTDEFIKFVSETNTPFCAFMFYDASHQPYHYPPEHAVFDTGTVTTEINYVKLARGGGDVSIAQLRNRYKNSLHYDDTQIGRVLQALEDRGLMDNTLIFIAGDHGEEFGEYGFFGHDSTYDPAQVRTLMVAHIPGQQPQTIRRVTSHLDYVPTVCAYMGVENPLADYTQGTPLLSTEPRPYAFITSWDTAALADGTNITTFGLEAYKAPTAVYNSQYKPLPNQRQELAARKVQLVNALHEMRWFTK
jgi:membrane-anchored protein YejM (alkaline phosphatase superfamily)